MHPAPTSDRAALPATTPTAALQQGFELPEPATEPAVEAPSRVALARSAAPGQRQGFRLGTLNLMIRYDQGSELTEVPALHRVPNAPAWFVGMTNLHGVLLPVLDLARYLGVQRDTGAKTMLLVLAHGADAAGVLIDGLPERLRPQAGDWLDGSIMPASLRGCISGACLIGERAWLDLDTTALLAQLESELAAPAA